MLNVLKKGFNNIGVFIRNNKWLAGIALVILGAIYVATSDKGLDYQFYSVDRVDVIDEVELTGKVSAVDRADLSFESSGKISMVLVNAGELVGRNQIIARLESGDLSGELSSAKASLAAAEANLLGAIANLDSVRAGNFGTQTSLESARANLAEVEAEQNQLVENANLALINNDLRAYQNNSSRSATPPVITGTYNKKALGKYILEFYRSGAGTGFSARVSGLESDVIGFNDYDLPVPLGDSGLYIALPESTSSYDGLVYQIPISNNRSATYQTLLNNLESAKASRDKLIAQARAEVDRLTSLESGKVSQTSAEERRAMANVAAAKSNVDQAKAQVLIVQSSLNDRVIRAPFSGEVVKADLVVGESVSAGQIVATLVSDGDLEIELQVPEIDVAKLSTGLPVKISLDAYGSDTVWQGEISRIENIDTLVEGVPIYLTTVVITEPDDRIKIGMNARASIELQKRENVLALPASYLNTDDDRYYVTVVKDTVPVEKTVEIGLRGADSMIEITSGITEGQMVAKERLE